jgi:hypothetical protein
MRIVVQIYGGCVQFLAADSPCQVYILDYDNFQGAPPDQLLQMGVTAEAIDKIGGEHVTRAIEEYEGERERLIKVLEEEHAPADYRGAVG